MEEKKYITCVGCGATHPKDRCIGCLHPFTIEEEKEQVKKGVAIIAHGSPNEEDDQLKFSIERGDLWKHRAISAELELEELKKKPGAVWVKGAPKERKLYHARFKGHLSDDIHDGIIEPVKDIEYWQAIASGARISIKGHHIIEYLDELETAAAGISQDAHEKEVMMQAFDKVRQIFEGRKWVMEGRGSYPYNDDRYKQEARFMYDEFDAVVKDTWANIKSKSVDYRKSIIAEHLESPAAKREDAVDFAEWLNKNKYYPVENSEWLLGGTLNITSTTNLYQLFKQQKKK